MIVEIIVEKAAKSILDDLGMEHRPGTGLYEDKLYCKTKANESTELIKFIKEQGFKAHY